MNDNNTIYIVTEDWQRHEINIPEYIRNIPTITWEDMAWISRASRIYGYDNLNDYVYDNLRNYNPTTRLSGYYTITSNRDFGDIYCPNEEKQILSFYYLNCDDA